MAVKQDNLAKRIEERLLKAKNASPQEAKKTVTPAVTSNEVNQGSLFTLLSYIMGGGKGAVQNDKMATGRIKNTLPDLFKDISKSIESLSKGADAEKKKSSDVTLSQNTLKQLNVLIDTPYKAGIFSAVKNIEGDVSYLVTDGIYELLDLGTDSFSLIYQFKKEEAENFKKLIEVLSKKNDSKKGEASKSVLPDNVITDIHSIAEDLMKIKSSAGKAGKGGTNTVLDEKSLKKIIQEVNSRFDTITHKIFVDVNSEGFKNLEKLQELIGDQSAPGNITKIIKDLNASLNELSTLDVKPVDAKVEELRVVFEALNSLPEITVSDSAVDIEKLKGIIENIKLLADEIIKIKPEDLKAGVDNINNFIDIFKTIDAQQIDDIQANIDTINDLIANSVMAFIKTMAEFNEKEKLDITAAYYNLDELTTLLEPLKKLEGIKAIKSKDIEKAIKAIDKNLGNIKKLMEDIITELDDKIINESKQKFQELNDFLTKTLSETEKSAKEGQATMERIEGLFSGIFESIDKIGEAMDNSKTTNISVNLEGLGKTILLMGITLLLGGWILSKHEDLVKASLKFGGVMAGFLFSVMLPIAIMARIAGGDAHESIREMGNLIVKMSLVMILAGLVMSLGGGKYITAAQQFAQELSKFLKSLLVPILIISVAARIADPNSLKEITNFIMKAAAVMAIGALVVLLDNGKFVKSALKFGLYFSAFMAITLLPIFIFTKLLGKAADFGKDFGKTVALLAGVMLIGALFVMIKNGKYIMGALKFGLVLSLFIAMILLPIKLLCGGKFGEGVAKIVTLKAFIVTTTIVLLVGALFIMIGNGKFAKAAITYTIIFAAFLYALAVPMIVFSKLKGILFKGLIAFVALVIASTVALLVGATIVSSGLGWDAIKGVGIMWLFTWGILRIAKKMSKDAPIAVTGSVGAVYLGVFMAAASVAIYIMAQTMQEAGFFDTVLGAGILLAFTVLSVKIMKTVSNATKDIIQGTAAMALLQIGMMQAVLTIWLLSLIKTDGLLEKSILLGLIVGATILMFKVINKATADIIKGAVAMLALAGSLSLMAIAMILLKYIETEGLLEKLGYLGLVMVGMIGLFAILTLLGPYVGPGTAVILAMSGSLILMSIAIFLLSKLDISQAEIGFQNLKKVLEIAAATYLYMTLLILPITLGSVSITLLSVSLLLLSGALAVLNAIDTDKAAESLKSLNKVMGQTAQVFADIGWLIIPITLGLISITELSLSLLMLSGAFAVLNLIDMDLVAQNLTTLDATLDTIKAIYKKLTKMFFWITAGSVFGIILSASLACIGGALSLFHEIDYNKIGENLKAMNETVLPGIEKMLKQIKGMWKAILVSRLVVPLLEDTMHMINHMNLEMWAYTSQMDDVSGIKEKLLTCATVAVDAYDESGGIKDKVNKLNIIKLYKVRWKMGILSDLIAYAIKPMIKLAMSEIPVAWDKDGNVTQTVKLDYAQMKVAGDNIAHIITKMADTFVSVLSMKLSNGDTFEEVLDDDSLVKGIVNFVKGTGTGISNIAEGLINYSKLLVPTEWDDNGKPIDFRMLTNDEIKAAGDNIGYVLTAISNALVGVLDLPLSNGDKFSEVLDDSSLMAGIVAYITNVGSSISGIAQGISDYAQLKVPTHWDENGNPDRWVAITDDDFTRASNNIQRIMSMLGNTLVGWAAAHEDFFDTGGGLFESEHPSQAELAIMFATGLGNVITSFATGLQKMATLSFPIMDKDGTIIGYEKITEGDIRQAGRNIKTIMSATTDAVVECADKAWKVSKSDIDVLKNMGDMVAGFADAINIYSQGGIPIKWDKNGKPIEFRQITDTDIDLMARNIQIVMLATSNAITWVYNNNKEMFDETIEAGGGFNKKTKSPMTAVMESMKGVAEFVKNLADGINTLASGQVPVHWNSEGQPDKFEVIDEKHGQRIGNVLDIMINSLFNGITNVWERLKDTGYFEPSPDGYLIPKTDSPIMKVVKAMQASVEPVKGIVETIKNLSELKVPADGAKIDKDGKASKYVNLFDSKTSLYDLEKKISNNIQTLISAVVNGVTGVTVNESIFDEKIGQIKPVLKRTTETFKLIADMVQEYSNLNFKEYDKDGNVKNVVQLGPKTFEKVRKNLTDLVCLMPDVLSSKKVTQHYNSENIEKTKTIFTIFTGFTTDLMSYITKMKPIIDILREYDTKAIEDAAKIIRVVNKVFKDSPLMDFVSTKNLIEFYNNINNVFYKLGTVNFKYIHRIGKQLNRFTDDTVELFDNVKRIYKVLNDFTRNYQNMTFKFDGRKVRYIVRSINSFADDIDSSLASTPRKSLFKNLVKITTQDRIKHIQEYIQQLDNTKIVLNLLSTSAAEGVGNIQVIDESKVFEFNDVLDQFSLILDKIYLKGSKDDYNMWHLLYYSGAVNTIREYTDYITKVKSKVVLDKSIEVTEAFGIFNSFVKEEVPEQEYLNRFKEEVESIKQLTGTFNNIDVGKVFAVKRLVDSMEKLGERFNDMDKFVDAVANKLVEALYGISIETANAAKVIADADKHQGKRQTEIANNINKMRNVVNKTLEVKIQKEDNNTIATPGPSDEKESPSGNTLDEKPGTN